MINIISIVDNNLYGLIKNVVVVYLVLIDVLKELLVKAQCLLKMNITLIVMLIQIFYKGE